MRAAGPVIPSGSIPWEEPQIRAVETFITTVITNYGYLAIFILMLLESACIPVPSELTMIFGGAAVSVPFLTPDQQLNLVAVALVGTAGNLVGSWLAYAVGYRGGRPLIDRWGRYLLLRPHEIDRAHDWFEHRGEWAVFGARLLPVIRTFISLPAGVARMSFWKFTILTIIGCLPWCFVLTYAGYKVGEHWDTLVAALQPFSWLILIASLALIGWWIVNRLRTRDREQP